MLFSSYDMFSSVHRILGRGDPHIYSMNGKFNSTLVLTLLAEVVAIVV